MEPNKVWKTLERFETDDIEEDGQRMGALVREAAARLCLPPALLERVEAAVYHAATKASAGGSTGLAVSLRAQAAPHPAGLTFDSPNTPSPPSAAGWGFFLVRITGGSDESYGARDVIEVFLYREG